MEQGCVTVSRDRTRKRRRGQGRQEPRGTGGNKEGRAEDTRAENTKGRFVGWRLAVVFPCGERLLCDRMSSLWLPFRSTSNNGHAVIRVKKIVLSQHDGLSFPIKLLL